MFEEAGMVPKFAQGKQVKPLSAEDMRAEISVNRSIPKQTHPATHPALVKAFNDFFK